MKKILRFAQNDTKQREKVYRRNLYSRSELAWMIAGVLAIGMFLGVALSCFVVIRAAEAEDIRYPCWALCQPGTEVLIREKIPFESRPEWYGSLVWECSIQKRILLVPACWNDIIVDLMLIPCEIDVPVPYGFFYREPVSEPLAEFLDFVRGVYSGTDPDAIVPVL